MNLPKNSDHKKFVRRKTVTLCFAWREKSTICFASDSRLSFGRNTCDSGIKVSRIPFTVIDALEEEKPEHIITSGDIGLLFSGSSSVALMTKEALSEVLSALQGTTTDLEVGMDDLSKIIFQSFKVITRDIGSAISEKAATSILFAGYCQCKKSLRAYSMEMNINAKYSLNEILLNIGDYQIIGSGTGPARKILGPTPNRQEFLCALERVIKDDAVEDVGGSIQYGEFRGSKFQPLGVAALSETENGISYWRGPIDLNSKEFYQTDKLIVAFPFLDNI